MAEQSTPELWKELTLQSTEATDAHKIESIQSLWSGYGEIFRVQLTPASLGTLVVKQIAPPVTEQHPRGWNTDNSHVRKLQSYEIETNWYRQWNHLCGNHSRVANHIASLSVENQSIILLEDLDASGFIRRHSQLSPTQAKACLYWLAGFHAQFLNTSPDSLWAIGTYWHLDTRPDEYAAMQKGPIKTCAQKLDKFLNACQYKTIVHGDAKVANFCFSDSDQQVAAVDFQYVGGGCGMKDVAYFIGSCFDEHQCQQWVPSLLDYYFEVLSQSVSTDINADELEIEWRRMFAPAWTDFHRFLLGWMPTHAKIHSYTESLANETLTLISSSE